jgi:hypothetical protein
MIEIIILCDYLIIDPGGKKQHPIGPEKGGNQHDKAEALGRDH